MLLGTLVWIMQTITPSWFELPVLCNWVMSSGLVDVPLVKFPDLPKIVSFGCCQLKDWRLMIKPGVLSSISGNCQAFTLLWSSPDIKHVFRSHIVQGFYSVTVKGEACLCYVDVIFMRLWLRASSALNRSPAVQFLKWQDFSNLDMCSCCLGNTLCSILYFLQALAVFLVTLLYMLCRHKFRKQHLEEPTISSWVVLQVD